MTSGNPFFMSGKKTTADRLSPTTWALVSTRRLSASTKTPVPVDVSSSASLVMIHAVEPKVLV